MPRSLTASILLAFACINIHVIRFFFLCCPVRRNLPWRKIRLITELQICIGYHVAFRVQDDRMYLLFQFTHVTQPYVNEQGITGGSVKTSDVVQTNHWLSHGRSQPKVWCPSVSHSMGDGDYIFLQHRTRRRIKPSSREQLSTTTISISPAVVSGKRCTCRSRQSCYSLIKILLLSSLLVYSFIQSTFPPSPYLAQKE